MKKDNILKWIGIIFISYIILTWILPSGYFNGGEFTKGTTNPVGLLDIIKLPIITLSSSVLILYGLIILVVGGFYGVLNKTGAYSLIVEKIAGKFKNNEKLFIIVSIIFFALFSSLTGLNWVLFAIVPLAVSVLMILGFKKVEVLAATFGSILLGNVASTYGFNISGYGKYFFNYGIHSEILFKALYLIVVVGILSLLVVKSNNKKEVSSKKETNKEQLIIPLYEKSKKKVSLLPIAIISSILLVISFIGMYNWEIAFDTDIFKKLHESITGFTIGNYPIFANLIGTFEEVGYWTNYDFAVLILISSVLIAWIYKLNVKEYIEGFITGAKQMLPVAIYAVIANVVFLAINSVADGATVFATITNSIFGITKEFNIILLGITSSIGSVLYNDFPYMLNSLVGKITASYTVTSQYALVAFIMQTAAGIVSLIVPTSVMLVVGLKYLNVSIKEWFDYIKKYLLILLGITIVFVALMYFI